MSISRLHAITNAEFVQMMGKCRPPTGWPSAIAVAASAGPDSTCLLFLLRRMIDWKQENKASTATAGLPDSILSLHVNHNLQSDAEKMARAADAAATKFAAAAHAELRVPWGEPPFPPRPDAGEALETVARTARYRLLFDAMVRRGAHVLATGHHADDQVETVLMRLGEGSSVLGLGGMRPTRRFGMALGKAEAEGGFGWFGCEGLRRWIVRPLLDVSKDRILATCDLNGVRYVLDRTNFQPELTLRNAIRHVLTNNERKQRDSIEPVAPPPPPLPPVLADKIVYMKTASEDLNIPIPIDMMANRANLHEAAHYLSRNLSDIESKASAYLSRFAVQAPPGTFILAADKLSTTAMDPPVQLAMVLRILRYISPQPWGSTRAQAGRRRESLQRIVQRVWDPDPASETRARFEAGANVLWTPLRISPDGRLRHGPPPPERGERFGWLASRAPPLRLRQPDLERDISAELSPPRRRAKVPYDNRFLVSFRLEAIPPGDPVMTSVIDGSGRVMLVMGGRWLWPQVVWRREGEEDTIIASISAPELEWYEPAPGVRKTYSTRPPSEEVRQAGPPWQDFVKFQFIRVLDEP